MNKNLTPNQISLMSAWFIATGLAFILIIFKILDLFQASPLVLVILILLTFGISYFTILFGVKNYIFRKIKLIYKNIRSAKVSTKQTVNSVDINENIFEVVEEDVQNWANDQQKEIDSLKASATFRREFLGNVSHEIKTPMFNIEGYIHTLLEGGLYDEKINMSFLRKAAKNVDRLNTIIEDLDIISNLESGQIVMNKKNFNIKKLTEEVFEELEILASTKNIVLQFKKDTAFAYEVNADPERIRQVLNNLITNAIKYSSENSNCKVAYYDMVSYILVEVADSGVGIPQSELKYIFDRFYRVEKSRSRDQGGSGLGLAIVKHILEAHNQTINVRSTSGVGSTFGFTLDKAI